MKIACIVRCIGVGVFAAALQAGAQPPAGKGKPEHAGASPFIRFPVPQHAVGVMRHSQAAAIEAKAPRPAAGNAFGKTPAAAPVVGGAVVEGKAAKLPEAVALATAAAAPHSDGKAPAPECGAR